MDYLAEKDRIAHSLTDFLMQVQIFGHPQTLFTRLTADNDLGKHVLACFLI